MIDPLSVEPSADPGASTQDWYTWQHHCIAVDCIEMIIRRKVRRVICEVHEDYIVEHIDGRFELVSCKHREVGRDSWRLTDLCVNGGVGHLFGLWTRFPETLVRLMTSGGLAAGAGEARAVAGACRRAVDGVSFSEPEMAACRDALARGLLLAGRNGSFPGIPPMEAPLGGRRLLAMPIPEDFRPQVERFMRSLSIRDGLPDRRFIESVHSYSAMRPCLEKLRADPARAPALYRQLVDLVHRKNGATPWTDAYGELLTSRDAATASGRFMAVVAARTIRAEDVHRLLNNSGYSAGLAQPPDITATLRDMRTPEQLAEGLGWLRDLSGLSLNEIERQDAELARSERRSTVLSRASLISVLNDGHLPTERFLASLLAIFAIAPDIRDLWFAAWQRAAAVDAQGPPGAVRVTEASAALLRIHNAPLTDGDQETLPTYVERDFDTRLRTALEAQGCFAILVGPSAAGKSRSLYESVKATLPNWWLVQPADAQTILTLADTPPSRTVIWLDEIDRYLNSTQPLHAATITRLLNSGATIVGTIWPGEYNALLNTKPASGETANVADTLRAATLVIEVPGSLTETERDRARELAGGDERLKSALDDGETLMTQVLAGGPALVRLWEDAKNPYAKAVLDAAIDARRLGAFAPLGQDLLTAAMEDYLPPYERITDPQTWLGKALPDVATASAGVIGPLLRISNLEADAGIGYVAADYLVHHASRTRRTICPPHSLWVAIISHAGDLADTHRVAASAHARMRYQYSEPVIRQFAALGDRWSTLELANLMVGRDQIGEAIGLIQGHLHRDSTDEAAKRRLADLCALRPKVEALRASTDGATLSNVAELLADRGRTTALQERALAGDPAAQDSLANLLAERGQIELLEGQADAGNRFAADRLAELCASHGHLDALRARADRQDDAAAFQLSQLLSDKGLVDELAARAAAGDKFALRRLILLAKEQSEAMHPSGSRHNNLSPLDQIAALRQELALGDTHAADRLTDLLLRLRLIPELWAETDAGTPSAADRMVNALLAENQTAAHVLNRLRICGLNADGTIATDEETP